MKAVRDFGPSGFLVGGSVNRDIAANIAKLPTFLEADKFRKAEGE